MSIEFTDKPEWNVKKTKLDVYLSSLNKNTAASAPPVLDDPHYSALKNARRTELEIAEIGFAISPKLPAQPIAYKPKRMAFHEAVAVLATEIQSTDDEDFFVQFNKFYRIEVSPAMDDFIKNKLPQIEDGINNKVKSTMQRYKNNQLDPTNADDKLLLGIIALVEPNKQNIGLYNNNETFDSLIQKIMEDKLYKQLVQQEVEKIVHNCYKRCLQETSKLQLKPLSIPNSRHTYMMSAGSGSGKSTSLPLMYNQMKQDGVDIADVSRQNQDIYRPIVGTPEEFGDDIVNYSSFNVDEVKVISKRVEEITKAKIAAGKAPNILYDIVDNVNNLVMNSMAHGNDAHIITISTPVEMAVNRAYYRGITSGHSVSKGYVPTSHKNVCLETIDLLSNFSGQNVSHIMVRNDVPKGTPPIQIQETDLKARVMVINDLIKVAEFFGKVNLNTKANSADEAYLPGTSRYNLDHLNRLQSQYNYISIEHENTEIIRLQKNGNVVIANIEALNKALQDPLFRQVVKSAGFNFGKEVDKLSIDAQQNHQQRQNLTTKAQNFSKTPREQPPRSSNTSSKTNRRKNKL